MPASRRTAVSHSAQRTALRRRPRSFLDVPQGFDRARSRADGVVDSRAAPCPRMGQIACRGRQVPAMGVMLLTTQGLDRSTSPAIALLERQELFTGLFRLLAFVVATLATGSAGAQTEPPRPQTVAPARGTSANIVSSLPTLRPATPSTCRRGRDRRRCGGRGPGPSASPTAGRRSSARSAAWRGRRAPRPAGSGVQTGAGSRGRGSSSRR